MKFLAYKFRNSRQQPSRLLTEDFVINANTVDDVSYWSLNSTSNLAKLIYENETKHGIKYLSEGLITTYPTKKFATMFKNSISKHVPDELKDLTFADVGIDDDIQKVYMYTEKTEESDNVSAMIAFAIPVYKSDLVDFQEQLRQLVDYIYVYGYDLTSVDKISHELMDDIDVLRIQFEARHSKDKFQLANELMHVAPFSLLEKIKKQGLVPKSKSSEFKYDSRVYLFNQCSQQLAVNYGIYKANQCNNKKFCVFKILKKKLEADSSYRNGKLAFYVDNSFSADCNVEAIFTYNNIKLSLLEDICIVFDIDDINNPKCLKFK